jgi:hypothetical protein
MQAIRSSRWCLPSTFQYRTFFSLPKVVPDIFDSRKVYSERKLLKYVPNFAQPIFGNGVRDLLLTHADFIFCSYSQAQVYDVVSNVTDYHQFIPFCSHSKVFSTKAVPSPSTPGRIIMQAELGVGFNLFNEKYMSKVTCDKPSLVKVGYLVVDNPNFGEIQYLQEMSSGRISGCYNV